MNTETKLASDPSDSSDNQHDPLDQQCDPLTLTLWHLQECYKSFAQLSDNEKILQLESNALIAETNPSLRLCYIDLALYEQKLIENPELAEAKKIIADLKQNISLREIYGEMVVPDESCMNCETLDEIINLLVPEPHRSYFKRKLKRFESLQVLAQLFLDRHLTSVENFRQFIGICEWLIARTNTGRVDRPNSPASA